MSQLTNPLQNIIDQAASKKAGSGITNTLARHKARSGGNAARKVILADTSSSMADITGAETKYDLLKKALIELGLDYNIYRLLSFASFPQKCINATQLPLPSGSTALHLALKEAALMNPSYTLIISDGEPDSETEAIAEADRLSGRIDVLYIGDENNKTAISFLNRLARRTGGVMVSKNIAKTKELPNAIRGLLQ